MKDYKILRFPNFFKKALTLSYDDANTADMRLLQVMNENGLKGTFNVSTGWITHENVLNENQLREIFDCGNELAVHGHNHLKWAEIEKSKLKEDIIINIEALEKITGKRMIGLAYPYGSYNDEVIKVVKECGLNYARTVESTEDFSLPENWLRLNPTCHHKNKNLFELTERFINDESNFPKLFYLWGHSYEFNNDNNWQIIEDFAKKIGKRDDIWYATNAQIFEYITAFDNLVIEEKEIYNPSQITIYINYNQKDIMIKPKQKIKM